ncbi:hypothetical protein ATE67_04335 [Sphingopyxis sp. H050]|jgi:hypothetical protein|uniref:hypothetical protein n=1 Tax=Sphingopyxis sp. H050 TaxID=1759072 RepID=UPI0007371061|nr:hypothetical protein [Sphingopyxis sp. H050]KTE21882.1 hypothetical protein ATE67_04335 [Sphingopyxis sp. H050]
MTRTFLIALPLLVLTACGNEPSGKSTTKLDSVEVQPGTISDSMIILDDSAGDGTAVDNSVPDDGTKKEATKSEENADAADEGAAADDMKAVESAPPLTAKISTDTPAKKGE